MPSVQETTEVLAKSCFYSSAKKKIHIIENKTLQRSCKYRQIFWDAVGAICSDLTPSCGGCVGLHGGSAPWRALEVEIVVDSFDTTAGGSAFSGVLRRWFPKWGARMPAEK